LDPFGITGGALDDGFAQSTYALYSGNMFRDFYEQQRRPRRYDGQQVCLNGHIVTNYANTSPEDRKKFCHYCGQPTIMACESCNAPLQGAEIDPEVVVIGFDFPPPAFCHECGAPHTWTRRKINTAIELAAEVETDPRELEKLRDSIGDLTTETPRTPLAVARFKKLVAKAGSAMGPAISKILSDIASEAIQKQLGLK
jgi:hypothetical protein